MTQSTANNPQIKITKPRSRGAILSNFGTILSAIMASACCWLPLLLLVFGVSGAGVASTLEAWRPLFIVVTFAFLAAAFYFTYRAPTSHLSSKQKCGAEQTVNCCEPSTRKFGWHSMNKIMLWAVAVLAVAFLFFPNYVGVIFGTNSASVTADMNQSVFEIDGMTCEGCATTVAKAIRNVPGVLAVDVNYE